MGMIEAKLKGFDKICDSLSCTPAEKESAHHGAQLFFEKDWPSNCFTVPMAISASRGQMPKRYMRALSRTQFEHRMDASALENLPAAS